MDKSPLLLNEDFRWALDLLEKTSGSLFITGRAGTGKSTLLQLFRKTTKKKIAVLAPTGVAALNVQGQTIHSFFGFPPRIVTKQEASRKVTLPHHKKLFKNLQTLVIDEISMVRADVLDAIDRFLQVNRENPLPFGGVQMVFFGDLFQLPPVVTNDPLERQFFTDFYETAYFFSAKVMSEPTFNLEMLELRKVFRQESRHFLRLLEGVRVNEVDRDDLEDLNERHIINFDPKGQHFITLCARNATADRINQTERAKLDKPEFEYLAEVDGAFDARLYPTELSLVLRNHAQVMFIKNDPEGNFVNGTIGKVIKLGKEKIEVEVEENEKKRTVDVEKMKWEVIRYRAGDKGDLETETLGSFFQYPLKLAWAITIHKSQGKTFDRMVIDLGGGAFEHGQLYVALSRCRTLEGIVLKSPIRLSDVITDERIIEYYSSKFR